MARENLSRMIRFTYHLTVDPDEHHMIGDEKLLRGRRSLTAT